MDLNGNQTVQVLKESFSAASKGFKRHKMMNKGLIKRNEKNKFSRRASVGDLKYFSWYAMNLKYMKVSFLSLHYGKYELYPNMPIF